MWNVFISNMIIINIINNMTTYLLLAVAPINQNMVN